ncbi:RsiV family protein [soil metagenome]
MKNIVATAIAAAMLSAVAIGMSGTATAAPLIDPQGICTMHDDTGNCWLAAGGPSVDIDVKIPASDPQEQAIVDYAGKVVDDFNADTQLGTLDNPRPLQELEVTTTSYTSGTPEAGTHTVVLEVYRNVGAAYPMTWYKSFTYNNAAKAPITFDTLFRPGTTPLDTLLPIVQQQMSATAGQPITIDPATGLDPANYQDFAITDDAVIFFFGKNQMHPAYGATAVSVPRSAIATLLNPGI